MNHNNHDLSFQEVAEKYPSFPRLLIRKVDTEMRGVVMTERAIKQAREVGAIYEATGADHGQDTPRLVFGGALFRDGSWVLGMEPMFLQFPEGYTRKGNPYTIDIVDGQAWLFDGKEPGGRGLPCAVSLAFRQEDQQGHADDENGERQVPRPSVHLSL